MASMDRAGRPSEPIFPRLTGGAGRMAPDRVARHQKARLEGAMVEAVSRHGYAGTTLRELVTLAGVSKSTFYEHFESKQDCFLVTFDEVVARLSARVTEAYRSGNDLSEQLLAGLTAFVKMTVDEPAAASLAAVESLTLGVAGVEHRERASRAFEAMIQQSFDHSGARPVSATTVRAIVAGIRGVTYARLRAGQPDELPSLVGDLVDWALSYQDVDSGVLLRAIKAAEQPPDESADEATLEEHPQPDWEDPPGSPASRASLTQRERIVRAAAQVVVEKGYEALSIPAISAAAGTSNQTFYEHFSSKRDPFLAAFEILAADALSTTAAAFAREEDRPEAIGASIRTLLHYIAEKELFARLAFFQLPTAGPAALDRADAMLESFGAFLEPGNAPNEKIGGRLPQTIREAIPSGIWAVIQYEIAHGRRESLPDLAPEITRIVLAPFSRS